MTAFIDTIRAVLNDPSREHLETLAQQARALTRRHFGRAIGLYTPLYLSNFCASHCTYCGFHSHNEIPRVKLTAGAIRNEYRSIAATGIRNILLLTGESPRITPVEYLKEAVTIAGEYFQNIGLEIYPLSTEDYRTLYLAGADSVTIYQETYDLKRYAEVHLGGQKQNYAFRRDAPRRIASAGMRSISLGILLGLGPLAEDLCALYTHLKELEAEFPGVEYSLSFPRLRTVNARHLSNTDVDDITFVKILCLTRILFPRVGINLSTRESADFRSKALELSITRMSAGSKTTVGGYQDPGTAGAPQFDISDERSTAETITGLRDSGFDPVFTDWRRIENT
jgi:2-iminoacetate synthase